jgi:tripartite-type tricarboxylate transporter receptor subunit TctC
LDFFRHHVHAQTYPNKPIRLVVPFAPGGSSSHRGAQRRGGDGEGLGQPIVIENKGGGGGNLAMSEVARADPTATR